MPPRKKDETLALALVPLTNEIAALIGGRIPNGVDFSIIVRSEERTIAVSTDQHAMAPHVLRWAMDVLNHSTHARDPVDPPR